MQVDVFGIRQDEEEVEGWIEMKDSGLTSMKIQGRQEISHSQQMFAETERVIHEGSCRSCGHNG